MVEESGLEPTETNTPPARTNKIAGNKWIGLGVLAVVVLAASMWYSGFFGLRDKEPIKIIYHRIEVLSPEFVDEEVFLSIIVLEQEGSFVRCKMEEFEDGRFACPEPLSLFGTFGQEGPEYQIWASDPARYNKETKSDFVASDIFIDNQKVDFRQQGKYQYGFFRLK